jgi:hypothetical protein
MDKVFIKDCRKLRVCETQSPKSQVGSCITYGSQNKLDSFYQLVNKNI